MPHGEGEQEFAVAAALALRPCSVTVVSPPDRISDRLARTAGCASPPRAAIAACTRPTSACLALDGIGEDDGLDARLARRFGGGFQRHGGEATSCTSLRAKRGIGSAAARRPCRHVDVAITASGSVDAVALR
jgi:hypothetical protein